MSTGHVTERELHRFVDGTLDADGAARVAAHCEACAACAAARAELEAVVRAVRADAGAEPLRPVWPHVRPRLRPARPGWAFALGTGLAVTAGLWIGLSLGSLPAPSASGANEVVASDALSSAWGSSLPDVYGLSPGTEAGGS